MADSLRQTCIGAAQANARALLLGLLAVALSSRPADGQQDAVDFSRDIRPLLSNYCFECHGPDEARRQADLRLDRQEDALATREGSAAIVPGDSANSELIRRVSSADPDLQMPPADTGRRLSEEQIRLLTRWIDEGAVWKGHWAFTPPERPPVTSLEPGELAASGARGPIDALVNSRLAERGLQPADQAARETLIRRLTLDLTGLPPTLEEIDAFLADPADNAYERLVDRLLASPAFGERMAALWLDLARYADTAGYQTDGERQMYRWRDWVIEAFNHNMPFDQFTVWQLAGDLLPSPTLPQRIATGFNRNHRANSEGGIVFEEYLLEYAVDRLDTTATVWMGLTLGCARCHDHKYDPFTQRDFYSLLAYFNQVPERGRVIKYGNSPPLIASPTEKQARELAELDRRLQEAQAALVALGPQLTKAQQAWEQAGAPSADDRWTISEGLAARYTFDDGLTNSVDPAVLAEARAAIDKAASSPATTEPKPPPPDRASFQGGECPLAPVGDAPGDAVAGDLAACFDGQRYIQAASLAPLTGADKFTFSAWVKHELAENETGAILSLMDDEDSRDKGVSLFITGGRLAVHVGPRWLDDALRVDVAEPFPAGQWRHVAVSYDGSQMAAGLKIYLDGQPAPARVHLDLFTGTFVTPPIFRIGSQGLDAHFRGQLDDVRCYRRELAEEEVAAIACRQPVRELAAIAADRRTPTQAARLRAWFLAHEAPAEAQSALALVKSLQQQRATLVAAIPTTMVMQDRPDVKETFILHRGEYDKPKEKVSPGVPASLPGLPAGVPNNRLGFARWLTSGRHPLVARVAVNRLWEMLFGAGLVRTTEDFGAQGQWPSHPELLDWLAVELVDSGWDLKAMLRKLATSAAYRRSSQVEPAQRSLDPDNLWWARASRVRLGAETIRDQALAAAGLLSRTVGGPSVKPRQPAGLWEELATDPYIPDSGENLYRRGLYTFWKRTIPPPAMTTFDAPSRESCNVRRSRTNTPLQALALMNDETYVEAARALAARMAVLGESPEDRLAGGFRLVLSRRPTQREQELLVAGWRRKRDHYLTHADEAAALLAQPASGDGQRDAEQAAYAAMASVILNLDEAITRE